MDPLPYRAIDARPPDIDQLLVEGERAVTDAGTRGDDRARATWMSRLAGALLLAGRNDDAEARWSAALPLLPLVADAATRLATLDGLCELACRRGDLVGARTLLERASRGIWATAELRQHLAERTADLERRCGRFGPALLAARAALALSEDTGCRQAHLAALVCRLHLERGERLEAAAALASAPLTLPAPIEISRARARLAAWWGDDEVVRSGPLDALRAWSYARHGETAHALATLADPQDPEDLVALGLIEHAIGRFDDAVDHLTAARVVYERTGWPALGARAAVFSAAPLAQAGRTKAASATLAESEEALLEVDPAWIRRDFGVTRAHQQLVDGDREAAASLLAVARSPQPAPSPWLRLRVVTLATSLASA